MFLSLLLFSMPWGTAPPWLRGDSQGQLPEMARKAYPASRPLERREKDWIAEQVSEFQDQDLKNALQGLGRAVLSRK